MTTTHRTQAGSSSRLTTRILKTSVLLAAATTLALTSCSITTSPNAAPTATQGSQAGTGQTAPAATQDAPSATATSSAAALAILPSIPAKGRAPKTGYKRDLFGPAWKDVDLPPTYRKNGCDQRNDVLKRDLSAVELKPGTHDCVVLSGHLADPYTGKGVDFVKGGASEVDIDHLVPLSDSWQKGAQAWDQSKRERFANDPANLAASSAAANRSKGDSDLATWLPPNRAHWCDYAAKIVQVKAGYGLWMTPAEHERAEQILTDCTT